MAGKLIGYHILLVEDDISSQILIEKVLTYNGASVVAMGSGEKAIDYLKDGNVVDVVILDLKLPRMDGYTVFNAIKEMLPAVPIFAQTAYIYGNEPENVLALGFDGYFSKPIDFDRLVDTILITKSSHSAK
ncbi:response regulator [Williamwhitmania taraxaci]|uniref:Two-component system, NarL family, capsular synthesis sensor histidine kinase RcsC n=1 Tax=Williamwhitmania taraxaci TaxID=1640674 RepID=A0A1G6HFC9_9BACT|nr:response regulator [Williamwhitmania taraxaci]SDB92863.1 two-component system, NarL family, capsular synthesis sensor histidine kinase RcsC [Williamwhitmania taraxaci]